MVPGEATLEEEEDVSRGDLLDFMTPRDISKARYDQHHEWMEEILESHYATKQIVPSDLGLGRKGELEALTSGFFEAPMIPFPEVTNSGAGKVGKMNPHQAEDFRIKASKKIAEMQEELQAMKRKHARKMEKLQRTSTLSTAEKRLRTAAYEDQQNTSVQTIDDIVQDVEGAWGKKIEQIPNVKIVEKGGLDQRIGTSALANGGVRNTMSPKSLFSPSALSSFAQQNGAESSTQQQQQRSQSQATHSPGQSLVNSLQTPRSEGPDSSHSPEPQDEEQVASPAKVTPEASQDAAQQVGAHDNMDVDVDMEEEKEQDVNPDVELDDNAWVMVDEGGDENVESMPEDSLAAGQSPSKVALSSTDAPVMPTNESPVAEGGPVPSPPQDNPNQLLDASALPDTGTLDTGDFDISDEFNDVNVDTAGDALADYGASQDDLNLDTMDDSAFGDAFHPSEDNNTPMEDQDIS